MNPSLYIDQTHEYNVTAGLFAFFAFFQLINVVLYFLAYERAEEEVIVAEEKDLEEKEGFRTGGLSSQQQLVVASMQSTPSDGRITTVTLQHTQPTSASTSQPSKLPTIEDEHKGEEHKSALSIIVPPDSSYSRGPHTMTSSSATTTPAVDDEGRSLLTPSLYQRTPMSRSALLTPGGRFLTTPSASPLYYRRFTNTLDDPKSQPKTPLQTMEKHADEVVHEFKWCFRYHEVRKNK